MPVLDLFSHRKRVVEGGLPDVFTYDELPHELRVQIVLILRDAIGEENGPAWQAIHNVIAREHGRFELSDARRYSIRCEDSQFAEDLRPAGTPLDSALRGVATCDAPSGPIFAWR